MQNNILYFSVNLCTTALVRTEYNWIYYEFRVNGKQLILIEMDIIQICVRRFVRRGRLIRRVESHHSHRSRPRRKRAQRVVVACCVVFLVNTTLIHSCSSLSIYWKYWCINSTCTKRYQSAFVYVCVGQPSHTREHI